MSEFEALDELLKKRLVPEMRSNLPERIIAAALAEGSKQVLRKKAHHSRYAFIFSWLEGVVLPSPALALSAALVVGVIIGLSSDPNIKGSYEFLFQTRVQADLGDML